MSEHPEHHEHHDRPEPGTTGHPGVDAVLRSLDGIDARPVEEHVAVFEAAHESLRAALEGAGDRQGSQAGR